MHSAFSSYSNKGNIQKLCDKGAQFEPHSESMRRGLGVWDFAIVRFKNLTNPLANWREKKKGWEHVGCYMEEIQIKRSRSSGYFTEILEIIYWLPWLSWEDITFSHWITLILWGTIWWITLSELAISRLISCLT